MFKSGDQIRCINNKDEQKLVIGEIYEVIYYGGEDLVVIKMDENNNSYFTYRFELTKYAIENNQEHYKQGKIEPIDVIEDWNLNFRLGNALKYIARCEHKENKIKDLKKALYYIQREIDKS